MFGCAHISQQVLNNDGKMFIWQMLLLLGSL